MVPLCLGAVYTRSYIFNIGNSEFHFELITSLENLFSLKGYEHSLLNDETLDDALSSSVFSRIWESIKDGLRLFEKKN